MSNDAKYTSAVALRRLRQHSSFLNEGLREFVWDDARLPDKWWSSVEEEDDCWVTHTPGYYPYAYLCRRLLGVGWVHVLAVVPTCGTNRCVNPNHLCVTLKKETHD